MNKFTILILKILISIASFFGKCSDLFIKLGFKIEKRYNKQRNGDSK